MIDGQSKYEIQPIREVILNISNEFFMNHLMLMLYLQRQFQ
ncbi:hypothetical protein CLPUN_12790 [Clostridium puniceum]|uniref:Uncharacterized protein n=1 Tax=Clostridium puniceum TaxID=29367 RepID=A0A1S8TS59_9CLOT|nr:hypothetical protein [Clostridium puniceum]OOM80613.1 hypothetical protein CLPUN_12790 [Clostridium puniceum]